MYQQLLRVARHILPRLSASSVASFKPKDILKRKLQQCHNMYLVQDIATDPIMPSYSFFVSTGHLS